MCSDDFEIALDCVSPEVSPELLSLMKEKLPIYVVKCFLASGYDCEENISYMNEDAVNAMEKFVQKRFSHESSMQSQFLPIDPDSLFEFPPGHKASIFRFIKQVKENHNTKHSQIFNCKEKSSHNDGRVSNKRANTTPSNEVAHYSKKMKTCSSSTSPTGHLIQFDSKVHDDLKSQINEWVENHARGMLKDLAEDHYSIALSKERAGVNIHCHLCNKDIKLQPTSKKDKFRISNWTKHIKSCFLLNFNPGQTKLAFKPILDSAGECSASSISGNSTSSPQTCVFSKVKDKGVAVSTKNTSKWSREERAKRQLLKAADDPCQSHITDYYKILNDVEKLLQANAKLSDLIEQHSKDAVCKEMKKDQSSPVVNLSFTPILKQLILNAEKNVESLQNHRRHPEILKKFATALLIYAGPLSYEFLKPITSYCPEINFIRVQVTH